MNEYDTLADKIEARGIEVIESPTITQYGVDGLWKNYNNKDYIFINPNLSRNEKISVLSEEYGHYLTSSGIQMDYNDPETAKSEHQARLIAAGNIVTLDSITSVLSDDSMTFNDIANEVDVKPEILKDAFDYFRKVFGQLFFYNGFKFDLRDGVKITRTYSMA